MTGVLLFQRWRLAAVAFVAVLMLTLVVATPQGRGAASDFLAQFRGDRYTDASLSTDHIADIRQTMTDLQRLGAVSGIDSAPDPQPVASIAEASAFVGFPLMLPDPATLPEEIDATPAEMRVIPAHEIRFTFDHDKARGYFASIGENDVSLPERFDGASLVVTTPPAVLLEYRKEGVTIDTPFGIGLMVGQSGPVTVSADGGVTLSELQEFLLDLPGFSPETVRQLLEIDNWKTTLPLPLPVDQITWERVTIDDAPGLLLNDNSGVGSAAIWERNGRIIGIAGAMKARELQRVAESFR